MNPRQIAIDVGEAGVRMETSGMKYHYDVRLIGNALCTTI